MAELSLKKEQFGSPEDVTTLFAWANMRGAKYRDFSASRAKAREEIRRRVDEAAAEESLRQMERAQREAQEAVQRAAREAAEQAEVIRRAEAERLAAIAREAEAERAAVMAAQEAHRRAAAQRKQSPQRMDLPVTTAPAIPVSSPHPSAEFNPDFPAVHPVPGSSIVAAKSSHASGADVDNIHTDFYGSDYAGLYGAEMPAPELPGFLGNYTYPAASVSGNTPGAHPHASDRPHFPVPPAEPMVNLAARAAEPMAHAQNREVPRTMPPTQAMAPIHALPVSHRVEDARAAEPKAAEVKPMEFRVAESAVLEDWERPLLPSWLQELPHALAPEGQGRVEEYIAPVIPISGSATTAAVPSASTASASTPVGWPGSRPTPGFAPSELQNVWFPAAVEVDRPQSAPASAHSVQERVPDLLPQPFLHQGFAAAPSVPAGRPANEAPAPQQSYAAGGGSLTGAQKPAQQLADDPLLASRERITRNWFALKSVFHSDQPRQEQPMPQAPDQLPVLAVFSLAGGVGKTTLLSALARALASRSERVLLVDLSAYGLMPFFFGARDQKPGQLRTFSPPGVTSDAPIQMITLDPERLKAEANGRDELVQEIQRHCSGIQRVLMDMPTASGATMRRVLRLNPTVLVPVTPDMNSAVSVGAIESYFQNQIAQANAQSQPLYVLNHFDPAQQLHLDVRNLLREQIGNRLLPFVLRSSSAVSEALAEGMTVMDYAPGTVIAEDYLNLANWIRSLSAPAMMTPRGVRWSER